MGALIAILAAVAVAITAWAAWRKGLSGIPLILGIWLMMLIAYLAISWFPPTPGQIAAMFFMAGLDTFLLAWGIYNCIIELCYARKEFCITLKPTSDNRSYLTLYKQPNATYGVLYGAVPWSADGADIILRALNEAIWEAGWKLDKWGIAYAEFGGIPVCLVMSIIRPKTFIDRILY